MQRLDASEGRLAEEGKGGGTAANQSLTQRSLPFARILTLGLSRTRREPDSQYEGRGMPEGLARAPRHQSQVPVSALLVGRALPRSPGRARRRGFVSLTVASRDMLSLR